MTAPKPFTGTALKRIACLAMLLDHIGASCLEVGVMVLWPNPTGCTTFAALAAADPAFAPLYWTDYALRMAGRLAFPLYCFLLAEGFAHTRSLPRYARRLGLFALLSEAPFDLAFFGTPLHPGHQNVYFTLLLGLGALWWLQRHPNEHTLGDWLCRYGGLTAFAAAAQLLNTDYGAMGVVLVAVFRLYRGTPLLRSLLAGVLLCDNPTALLALPLTHGYNGQRGRCSPAEAKLFYAFYPVHLALLAAVTCLLRR